MKLATWKTLSLASLLTLVLAACGGGGDSSGGSDGGSDGSGGGNPGGDDPNAALCLNEGGTDPDSSTASWADNCVLSASGSHANSLYTQGVQRILFCRGFDGGAATLEQFANGQFDADTTAEVEAFQQTRGLTVNGRVDAGTWAALRNEIEFEDITPDGFSGHKVVGTVCPQMQFFQSFDADANDGDGANLGWSMTAGEGEGRVAFSREAP